jgi:hypothetical protein
MAEETSNDGATWCKTTAWPRGLGMRKELKNGASKRWLTSGEEAVVAHLGAGEKAMKGVEALVTSPLYRWRTERVRRRAPRVGVTRWRWARPAEPWHVPVSPVLGCWWAGLGQVLKGGASQNRYQATLFLGPDRYTQFSIFLNWTKFVNYKTHPSIALKFTKLCNLIEWKTRNNLPSGSKFTFKTKLELEFLEEIYFWILTEFIGGPTCLEKSDKFSKILICLDLPEPEFRLAWLYSKICRFHTSSICLGLKMKKEGFEFEFKIN